MTHLLPPIHPSRHKEERKTEKTEKQKRRRRKKENHRQIKGEYEPSQNIDKVRKGTKKNREKGESKGLPISQLSLETQVGQDILGLLADRPDLLHRLHVF